MVVALTIFSAAVLASHERWGRAQFDSELASLGAATSRVMQEELGESGRLNKAATEVRSAVDVPDRTTAILDAHGGELAADWHGFQYDVGKVEPGAAAPIRYVTIDQQGQRWRVRMQRESSTAGDYVILVAGTLTQLERQHALLGRVLLMATPVVVLLTAAISWWVASAALRPVTAMAAQAEAITVRSADWRLVGSKSHDELGQLASAFNRLLVRLSAAAEAQQRFMADASHELRTPLSVIQTTTEVTLERPDRDAWEYREALTIINEQSARLKRMVEDMLVLARADASGFRLSRRSLYLDDTVAACARALSMVAAARNITIHAELEPEVSIHGDDGLVRQLATNLLANAIQYTPAGGSVTVAVAGDSDARIARLIVSDTGPGIPPSDRERVFERFVRLDPARSTASGAGLGLSIARWIAEQHDGVLTVDESESGGCRFVVQLPLTDP
jgi:two-component system OmpR family sensor kinase